MQANFNTAAYIFLADGLNILRKSSLLGMKMLNLVGSTCLQTRQTCFIDLIHFIIAEFLGSKHRVLTSIQYLPFAKECWEAQRTRPQLLSEFLAWRLGQERL